MTILIVDDEIMSVEGIMQNLDWHSLGITEVFPAYGMAQAVEVFRHHEIDVLLCDIEMPRGNGIELMEWVRENQYHPVCVFLTSFSKFEYAQSSVRLQMFDYILKPCEYDHLAQVLQRAVARRRELLSLTEHQKMGALWEETAHQRLAAFWSDALQRKIPLSPEGLKAETERRHLDAESLKYPLALLLLRVIPRDETQEDTTDNPQPIIEIIRQSLSPKAISISQAYVILLDVGDSRTLQTACEALIGRLEDFTHQLCLGFLSLPFLCGTMEESLSGLQRFAARTQDAQSRLFSQSETYLPVPEPSFPDHRWVNALLSGKPESIETDLRSVWLRLPAGQYVPSSLLHQLYHRIMGVIHQAFQTRQIEDIQHYFQPVSPMEQTITGSIPAFLAWVHEVTVLTANVIRDSGSNLSSVDTAKQYIRQHLEEDLSRNDLARLVHLNPDYFSSMFHQQTGMTLTDYITLCRVEAAEKLLLSTDYPISEVATRTGFQTISYFSKQFKRLRKETPYQFRKKERGA